MIYVNTPNIIAISKPYPFFVFSIYIRKSDNNAMRW